MTRFALLLLAAASAAQAAPTRIGAAGGVSGGVSAAEPSGAKPRALRSGDPVFHKDAVTTDAKGRMQAMLLDETVFTVGPNSKVVLDEFVYDPFADAGKVRAEVVRGVFRLVTGKSARRNPDIKVKTPSGTIGIRGTIAGGSVDGDRTLVALLGPGPDNNADEKPGAVTVSNDEGSVDLDQPGTGTVILPGEPPSPPFALTPADLAALDAGGSSQASGSGGGETAAAESAEASAADESGENTALGGENAIQASEIAASGGSGPESAIQAIQTAAGIRDGISTWDNVRTIESGQYHFFANSGPFNFTTCNPGPCANNTAGTMWFAFDIDFGARTVGGGNSYLSASDSDTGVTANSGFASVSGSLPSQSFRSLTGDAVLSGSLGAGASYSIAIQNSGGNAATSATATASYDDGTSSASGSLNAPRFSGSAPAQ